ncbi:hypothetical protein EV643_11184 [Kribbella sp. VKM Ac-2527]|uniref:Uncharacterized protein n=1 Tax=Kribbella caucasensis TaxID=2512215 RepID=A0A4R6K8W5_9ACTN|nr:hypothetical protein EV643_11184 [Kribbella sp. VKM Ac-2527]
MAPYLAAVRNYWALLPAIAVCVVLILLYAVPTLINPRWTSTALGLFQQHPEDGETRLTPKRIKSRRMLAGLMVLAALALVGFNVSLNRESNGCYQVAQAWGAGDSEESRSDPCIHMLYGSFIGDGSGDVTEENPQPVTQYQVVEGNKPKYLRWIQNRPSYDDLDLVIGVVGTCSLDVKVVEYDEKIMAVYDATEPCQPGDDVSILSIKLKKPLGDRPVVTVDDKPMQKINPDMDSWPTVLKKLVTGG